MPGKRIGIEPLTNAEKQERYRRKHTPDTEESLNRKERKTRRELHGIIDKLSEMELYAFRPFLLFFYQASQALTEKNLEKLSLALNESDLFSTLEEFD